MNDEQALHVIQNMKLEILRKGSHELFINGAGSLMFHPVGSKAATEAEHMAAFDIVGVYDKRAKLANILRDCGL